MNWLQPSLRDESGQGLGEYTVLISIITQELMLVLIPFREAIVNIIKRVANFLNQIL